MAESVSVRRANPGDDDLIAAVFARLNDTADPDAIRQFLDSPMDHVVLAEIDGELAGIAMAHELRRLDRMRGELFLYSIDTVERFQRRGVARAMIEELRRIGRDLGLPEMFVLTNESNSAAMALYANTGGKREGDDVVMFDYLLRK